MNDFMTILNKLLTITTGPNIATNLDGTINLGATTDSGLQTLKNNISDLSNLINSLYLSPVNLNTALLSCISSGNNPQLRTHQYILGLFLLSDLLDITTSATKPVPSDLPPALQPITPSFLQTVLNVTSPTLPSDINAFIIKLIAKYNDPTGFPAPSLEALKTQITTNLFVNDPLLQTLVICMNTKKVA